MPSAYLSVTTENKLTGMVMVHSCHLTVNSHFIDCSACAKIEDLKCELQKKEREAYISNCKKYLYCRVWGNYQGNEN